MVIMKDIIVEVLKNPKQLQQGHIVVTDNIVIHKMSCTYTQTPSHKPNGKSIQNRGKHAHAHNSK